MLAGLLGDGVAGAKDDGVPTYSGPDVSTVRCGDDDDAIGDGYPAEDDGVGDALRVPLMMLATMRSALRWCSLAIILGPSMSDLASVECDCVRALAHDTGGADRAEQRALYAPGGELRAAERTLTGRDGGLAAGARTGASLSPLRCRVSARNFLCGLYASSMSELVSKRGGAWRTRFRTGMSSTLERADDAATCCC